MNLHTQGPLSNHNCAFQLHHVTKLLNASRPKNNKKENRRLFEEISPLKLFKMMTVFSWSCFALKKKVDRMNFFMQICVCGLKWETFLWSQLNALSLQFGNCLLKASTHKAAKVYKLQKLFRNQNKTFMGTRMIIVSDKVPQLTQCSNNQHE